MARTGSNVNSGSEKNIEIPKKMTRNRSNRDGAALSGMPETLMRRPGPAANRGREKGRERLKRPYRRSGLPGTIAAPLTSLSEVLSRFAKKKFIKK